MMTKLIGTMVAALVLMACLSSAVMAGRAAVLYGLTRAHQYGFQPDERIIAARNPSAAREATEKPAVSSDDKIGVQAWPQWGNRHVYREKWSTDKSGNTAKMQIGAKLGTSFPTTIFNKDSGKGKELSRVFK